MEEYSDKISTAINYAKGCHESTNHLYDGKPYVEHLIGVAWYANKFIHLIPAEDRVSVISAAWCHDVIEDTRQTYNDVCSVIGRDAANIVYALTNEKGKTREERANSKYYAGILATKYATYVKVCDRLANAQYSKEKKSGMFEKYKAEQKKFRPAIYQERYKEMFDYLDNLFISK